MATIAAFHNSFREGLVTVDRAWIARNIGVDPTSIPIPPAAFARRVAASPNASLDDLQREIIDFDSEGSEGAAFLAFTKATGLSRFVDIPWPKGLAPTPATRAPAGGAKPLPRADVLIVTWTVDEGHALSRVLTPAKDSRNDYVPYTHNYAALAKQMSKGSPAVEAKQLGAFWTTTIGTKKVVVLKSDSHLSQDTDKHFPANGQLPNAEFWKQIIGEVQPKLVLTTGTAGGIGKDCEVGDVVVSPIVRFDSTSWLKKAPFAAANYASQDAKTTFFSEAKTLFKANASQLPADNTRPPAITVVKPSGLSQSVVTTDFFGFDTSDNHFKLQGLGDVSEMGDAVLGMVAQSLGESAPPWLAIRNVSDPEIAAEGTLKQQAQAAATIYKAYGRWSSVCSAIVCWAAVAAL
jgi:purine-nucleoside phosphorylase